jgi:phosphomevalonate kinase
VKSVASAPGKIVLSGEYAVLSGAPAICMAIKRRAIVTVADSPGAGGYVGADAAAIIDAVNTQWRQARNFELDTRAFSEHGNKIGLGSSAALVVALVAALADSTDVFPAALKAHRRFQGGAGSGVDVAAAVHGGLIDYVMQSGNVRSLAWPEGLAMRVLWTGVSASTSAKLHKLAATRAQPSRAALVESAERMAETWRSGDAGGILAGYAAYIDVLRQFSLDHDLGIFDAGHDELTDAAKIHNLVYKPAGAGGGDVGVLFGKDPAALDAFIGEHGHLIHDVVACELDPTGVRLDSA